MPDSTSAKVKSFLRSFQNDPIIRDWIDRAQKKPEKYKDIDMEFLTVVINYMEKLAKAVVLLDANKTAKLMAMQTALNEHEDALAKVIAAELSEEWEQRRKERNEPKSK